MKLEAASLLNMLKAAGEPTRLRLLALVRERDLSVGELVQILDQSQPRLSHHLRVLAEADLVERLPEGAFVFYRASRRGEGRIFLDHLFSQIEPEIEEIAEDRARLQTVNVARNAAAEAYFADIAPTWDRVRELHFPNDAIEAALLDMAGPGPFRRLVDFGTGTGRMLVLFADRARDAEGIDFSHHMLTVARANLDRAGVSTARVRRADVTDVPFDEASADLVIIHQVLHFLQSPARAIAEAARILAPGGRLLIVDFAPHDLEFLRAEHGHHRLGVRHDAVVDWAGDAGVVVSPPRSFAPPKSETSGLTVNIWAATKPSLIKERAA